MIVCVSVNVVNVFSTMLIHRSFGLDLKVDQDPNLFFLTTWPIATVCSTCLQLTPSMTVSSGSCVVLQAPGSIDFIFNTCSCAANNSVSLLS